MSNCDRRVTTESPVMVASAINRDSVNACEHVPSQHPNYARMSLSTHAHISARHADVCFEVLHALDSLTDKSSGHPCRSTLASPLVAMPIVSRPTSLPGAPSPYALAPGPYALAPRPYALAPSLHAVGNLKETSLALGAARTQLAPSAPTMRNMAR